MKGVTRSIRLALRGRGRLEATSPRFHRLVPSGVRIERLATGFRFTEGPVWWASAGCLIFSDIPADALYRLRPGEGVDVFRRPSGNSNGCTLDSEGRLIVCEHRARRVVRTERDGTITVLADRFEGRRLNSPNDVVCAPDGAVYFTDPPYGIRPEEQEQSVQGVYRVAPGGGEVRLVASDFDRPNGLAFSPCGSRLYVSDSSPRRHVRWLEVGGSGGLSGGGVLIDMACDEEGSPDGLKVDVEGNLYCTGPGGLWVARADGSVLGRIVLPEVPANCAWGEPGQRSLFVTARTSVYRIRCSVAGMPVGSP